MALLQAKTLIRMSRLRVVYGMDPDTQINCYELGLFADETMKGLRKLVIDAPNMHVLAAELEACIAVLKAHIAGDTRSKTMSDATVSPLPTEQEARPQLALPGATRRRRMPAA